MLTITIVMAVYNGQRFLAEQLKSFAMQSRKADQVLIGDDGSTDDSVNIIRNFINDHSLGDTWRLIVNEKNKGYGKNFVDLACKARGDLIFFSDQDDIWHADKLEVIEREMEKDSTIQLLCSGFDLFYSDRNSNKLSKKQLSRLRDDGTFERQEFCWRDFHLKRWGCTMCIRREFMEKVAPHWVADWHHDEFLWKMALVSSGCVVFQRNLMDRRMHSNNTTRIRVRTREDRLKQINNSILQFESLLDYAINEGLNPKQLGIIRKCIDADQKRLALIKDKKILRWFELAIKYRQCYPRTKGLFLDLYLALFNKCTIH